ncbi:hypothetical protein KFZ58_13855 [Virgibacillus sp. NKC19-16]|uniref:hypothetical protein n=1 Tax=Virgibacillus salidurans TaxID=2831673 RepID=UPI001F355FA2|nr:hypothetical protein [Virgibacillus sp. NKC19-16]UJL45481.1 hypothetical protein KFZ58_13855 [Virgibacillus sp. NKC19-16]
MKKFSLAIGLALMIFLPMDLPKAAAEANPQETEEGDSEHNWQEYSTDYNTIQTGSHEYTYWKNFMRETGTCEISQRIKTVVYYCDIHDHTKSETEVEETTHSGRHS